MEGAAIGQVCYANGIDFAILRAISDNADDTSKLEYRDAEAQTARLCAGIVARAVELLA
jgi:adenosylhomocysteine nucleosidase